MKNIIEVYNLLSESYIHLVTTEDDVKSKSSDKMFDFKNEIFDIAKKINGEKYTEIFLALLNDEEVCKCSNDISFIDKKFGKGFYEKLESIQPVIKDLQYWGIPQGLYVTKDDVFVMYAVDLVGDGKEDSIYTDFAYFGLISGGNIYKEFKYKWDDLPNFCQRCIINVIKENYNLM